MVDEIPAFYRPQPVATGDARLTAPPAARTRGPILDVLRRALPATGTILEIGSGTGEHVTHFADALPALVFQPSDLAEPYRRSVAAWAAHANLSNVRQAVALDVFSSPWPVTAADAVVSLNVLQVAPPEAVGALVAGAARILPRGGPLVIYGPCRVSGKHVAQSNIDFDAKLRATNPNWGVRDTADLAAAATAVGMSITEIVEMPSDNRMVIIRRG